MKPGHKYRLGTQGTPRPEQEADLPLFPRVRTSAFIKAIYVINQIHFKERSDHPQNHKWLNFNYIILFLLFALVVMSDQGRLMDVFDGVFRQADS